MSQSLSHLYACFKDRDYLSGTLGKRYIHWEQGSADLLSDASVAGRRLFKYSRNPPHLLAHTPNTPSIPAKQLSMARPHLCTQSVQESGVSILVLPVLYSALQLNPRSRERWQESTLKSYTNSPFKHELLEEAAAVSHISVRPSVGKMTLQMQLVAITSWPIENVEVV